MNPPTTYRADGLLPVILCLLLCILLPVDRSRAQESDQLLTEIQSAFMKSSATELANHIPQSVEIAMFGAARFYSRGQATLLLKQFFSDYPTNSFKVDDFTKTTNGWFIEANQSVKRREEHVRVYLRLRRDRTGWKIREILFEHPDE